MAPKHYLWLGRWLAVALASAIASTGCIYAQKEQRVAPHDPLGLWQARLNGWNLPLLSSTPPHHHTVFAIPASLELWGRPTRFAYYAGHVVDEFQGHRFAFGEASEDVVWIGETRSGLARRVVTKHAESWRKESAPRRGEAPWDAPLEGEAARAEIQLRLGRVAWGQSLRDNGVPSTMEAFARARGEHEILFALGSLLARPVPPTTEADAVDRDLAGLFAALGHSHYPHEVLRSAFDPDVRLAKHAESLPRFLSSLRTALEGLPADALPQLDRERQALAQLDLMSAAALRRAAAAAASHLGFVAAPLDREPTLFPDRFRLNLKHTAGGGLSSAPKAAGIQLQIADGRPRLERGVFGPWSEDVETVAATETSPGAILIRRSGVLQIYFESPRAISSGQLRIRHRLASGSGAKILLTIDGAAVLDSADEIPADPEAELQVLDITKCIKPGYPQWLMLSLSLADSKTAASYALLELELVIEE